MKKLIIMRGLPGSGKSTLARQLGGPSLVFSTDDFWSRMTGEYRFDISWIGEAHTWNRQRVQESMAEGASLIVVDNTNTTKKEVNPYLKLAQEYGYETEIIEPTTEWAKDPMICAQRTTHGVPLQTIKQMAARSENF